MNTQAISMMLEEDTTERDDIQSSGSSHYLLGAVISICILILTGAGILKMLDPRSFPVRHVSVKGDFQHLSTQILEERASKVVRGGYFNVNVDTIQRVLMEEPWVKSVTVKRIWPDAITIHISEQVAVARWHDQALINTEAQIFKPEAITFPAGLPLFVGPKDNYSQLLELYYNLQKLLPENITVSEIFLSERRAWRFKLKDGPMILLGRTDIDERLQRIANHITTQLAQSLHKIETIDMRYTNGFSVQWAPDFQPESETGR